MHPEQQAKSSKDRLDTAQRADPDDQLIIEYLEEGTLPSEKARARDLG